MNNIHYAQKVSNWLTEKVNCNVVDVATRLKYYQTAIKILNLDENDVHSMKVEIAKNQDLRSLYMKFSKDEKAISRKGENRSWTQYFKDMITGWILEDLTIEMLKNQGIEVSHNGKDLQRVIDIGDGVRQDADIIVKVGEHSRKVELTHEFNDILQENGFIEKRAPALFQLWEDKGIWVYRDIPRGKYVLIDFANENITIHLRHHNNGKANWSKDVHRYFLEENGKKERDDKLLTTELVSIVGCGIKGNILKPKEILDKDSLPTTFVNGLFSRNDSGKEKEVKADKLKEEKKHISKDENHKNNEEVGKIKVVGQEESVSEEDYGDGDFV